MVFAFITVIITVHAYVFYSLYVVNRTALLDATGAESAIGAIRMQGGVYMFGHILPVWNVILIEFCFAYCLEVLVGSPLSFKLACKVFDPRKTHPVLFETAIICATVGIMCPTMSFAAAFLYFPYYSGFSVILFIATWIKLICFNFPFAFFTQLFFFQPFVRTVFKLIFRRDIKKRAELSGQNW